MKGQIFTMENNNKVKTKVINGLLYTIEPDGPRLVPRSLDAARARKVEREIPVIKDPEKEEPLHAYDRQF